MNLLELLSKELQVIGKNKDMEMKKRYIYWRLCQLFSYDADYHTYIRIFQDYSKAKLIFDFKPNIENITNFNIVCSSWAYMYSELVKKLLGVDCYCEGVSHRKVIFNQQSMVKVADACGGSDLARMKMKLATIGYNLKDKMEEPKLKKIDKKLNYINDEYENFYLNNLRKKLLDIKKSVPDLIQLKLNIISKLYTKYDLKNFNDYRFCIDYLILKLFDIGEYSLFNSYTYVDNKDEMSYYWLCEFKVTKDIVFYYMLKKADTNYVFEEISKNDAINYNRTLITNDQPVFR